MLALTLGISAVGFAATKDSEPPDREMLKMMELLREMEMIKQIDMTPTCSMAAAFRD